MFIIIKTSEIIFGNYKIFRQQIRRFKEYKRSYSSTLRLDAPIKPSLTRGISSLSAC